jgi:hypothetical protein
VDERTRRIGLNEAVFREVNERLADLGESFPKPGRKLDLICECGNASCARRLEMDHEEYERLRADPATFATVPGHVIPDVEEIVKRREAYDVVRKVAGSAEKLAEATDPRSEPSLE